MCPSFLQGSQSQNAQPRCSPAKAVPNPISPTLSRTPSLRSPNNRSLNPRDEQPLGIAEFAVEDDASQRLEFVTRELGATELRLKQFLRSVDVTL